MRDGPVERGGVGPAHDPRAGAVAHGPSVRIARGGVLHSWKIVTPGTEEYLESRPKIVVLPSKPVRVDGETYEKLRTLADSRPLGLIVKRAVDAYAEGPGDAA